MHFVGPNNKTEHLACNIQFFNGFHINEFKEISKLLLIYHTFYFFSVTKCDLNFKGTSNPFNMICLVFMKIIVSKDINFKSSILICILAECRNCTHWERQWITDWESLGVCLFAERCHRMLYRWSTKEWHWNKLISCNTLIELVGKAF